jgi:hypothetical protein
MANLFLAVLHWSETTIMSGGTDDISGRVCLPPPGHHGGGTRPWKAGAAGDAREMQGIQADAISWRSSLMAQV